MTTTTTTTSPRLLSATTLIGDTVRNTAGEDLGKIEDLMIDLDFNRVGYVCHGQAVDIVVSFGGFLGIGDKLFAVPLEALTLTAPNHEFILNVSRERLESAPGFDKDNWPNTFDRSWGASAFEHYGHEPYWS